MCLWSSKLNICWGWGEIVHLYFGKFPNTNDLHCSLKYTDLVKCVKSSESATYPVENLLVWNKSISKKSQKTTDIILLPPVWKKPAFWRYSCQDIHLLCVWCNIHCVLIYLRPLNITLSSWLWYICYWPSVRSRWLDIGQVLFFAFLWPETKSRSIKTQKRTRPISSHLDRTSLDKDLLYISGNKAGNPERAR